jgi:DNA polymerase II large subunit
MVTTDEAATLIEQQARRIEILTKGSKVQLEDRLIEQIEQQARRIEELDHDVLAALKKHNSCTDIIRACEQQLTTAKAELEKAKLLNASLNYRNIEMDSIHNAKVMGLEKQIYDGKAELEALRKDRERLDWLETQLRRDKDSPEPFRYWLGQGYKRGPFRQALDAAIDKEAKTDGRGL